MSLYVRSTSAIKSVPSAPSAPNLTVGDTELVAAWAAPADDGGATVSSYDLRHEPTVGGSWTTVTGASSPATITSLTNGTSYDVQVRAVNSVGAGAWSSSSSATPSGSATITLTVTSPDSTTDRLSYQNPAENEPATAIVLGRAPDPDVSLGELNSTYFDFTHTNGTNWTYDVTITGSTGTIYSGTVAWTTGDSGSATSTGGYL